MPGTIRLHIDQFDETAKTWADTSGNGYHATATNAPVRAMQNGLAVAEFVKSEADEFVTAPVPAPTTSATFLFVGYLPPSENNEYDGLMILRDGYAGALATGLFVSAAGGVTYVWDSIFIFAGVARSNELALYAVTISPTEAKVYRIDSSGTIVATNTAAHNAISFSQNRPLSLGDDNTIAARNTNFKARFFEYYQNQVLTQIDLEGIYQFLIADDIRPSDVAGLTAIGLSANQINLTWNAATDNIGVTEYRIERATNETFTQNLVSLDTSSTATARAVTGLSADTRYYFRVKAKDNVGNLSANWSNVATAETLSILDSYFERFELSKILNINQLDLEMPILTADFGDGYAAGIIAGKSTGLRYWTISAEILPDLDETTIEFRLDGEVESDSRFNYFWEFYRRHLALGNKPFYFVDPRTSRKFLASFMDKRISFESITAKLYRGGVAIKQRRVKISGINFRADDGSVSN